MLITGDRGDYFISNCTFEDNRGINGAAISLEGNVNSFQVKDSKFIENKASLYGGAIYMKNQSNVIIELF